MGPPARRASSTADAVIRRSISEVGVDLCMLPDRPLDTRLWHGRLPAE
jgi:hypothetical protein